MKLRAVFLLLFAALTLPAFGQTADSRVKTHLDNIGLKYTVTPKGNFKVVFDLGNNRTQVVIINSGTYQYEGLEIREIYAAAAMYNDKTTLSQQNLFMMLEKNETYKIGSWQIAEVEGKYRVEFGLRISADAPQAILDELLRLTARTSDDLEAQLTSADDF